MEHIRGDGILFPNRDRFVYKSYVNIKVMELKTVKGQKSNLEKMYRDLMRFDNCLSPEQIAEMNNFFDNCFSRLPINIAIIPLLGRLCKVRPEGGYFYVRKNKYSKMG